jgi:voltage-gated potassium channel
LNQYKSLYVAFLGLTLVMGIGTSGYRVIEGWPLLDCIYMTVITLTTIGFSEVHPLSDSGKIFTIGIIFAGIGMVGYAFVSATSIVVEGEFVRLFSRRRSMKSIGRMHNHIVVCGFGRMGSAIAQELHNRGIPFVVVEKHPDIQERVLELGFLMSPGDATEESVLRGAGVISARGLVAVLDSDAENVYTVLTARELNPRMEIVARAEREAANKKLIRAGANRVVSSHQIGGLRMVMGLLKPAVMEFLEVVMDHKELNLELEEIKVRGASSYAGKKLVDTDIRRDLNLIVIGIKRPDGRMVFNPGPGSVIEDGDTLIVMGHAEALATCKNEAEVV